MVNMSREFSDAVKYAALSVVGAQHPMEIHFATVVSESPLAVKLDQLNTIDEDFLALTYTVRQWIASAEPGTIVGTKVLVIRQQGGQNYFIIDRA